jgi:glutathione S-transferase
MSTLILLNYTSTGSSGFGGMFALAGGFKATITARLGGAPLDVRGFALGEGKLYEWGVHLRKLAEDEIPQGRYTYRKDPAFVKATGGYGTIPALLSEDGSIGCCESNAIARTVARACTKRPMYGRSPWEQAQIDMFLDKCLVFERDTGPWIDFVLFGDSGGFSLDEQSVLKYKDIALKWFKAVDGHLSGRSFLVGEEISVADVVLACQLLVPWCCLLDEATKDETPHLRSHLQKLWEMPEFKADLGEAITALTNQFTARQGKKEQSA